MSSDRTDLAQRVDQLEERIETVEETVTDSNGRSWSLEGLIDQFGLTRREALAVMGLLVVGYTLPTALVEAASAGTNQAGTAGGPNYLRDLYVEDIYDGGGNIAMSFPGDGSVDIESAGITQEFTPPYEQATSKRVDLNPPIDGWTKYSGNPILTSQVDEPYPVHKDGEIWLYYMEQTGATQGVTLATSSDGINFAKSPSNPLLTAGGAGDWDEYGIQEPKIYRVRDTWHMIYMGFDSNTDQRFGHATSPDGINWTKDSGNPKTGILGDNHAPAIKYNANGLPMMFRGAYGPDNDIYATMMLDPELDNLIDVGRVLTSSQLGSWADKGLSEPGIVQLGDYTIMHLSAKDSNNVHSNAVFISMDGGQSFYSHPNNPILTTGGAGDFDEQDVEEPRVSLVGNKWHYYYAGKNSSGDWNIGLATKEAY